MPHMNGLELVRSVREIGFKGRIVVMSGRLNREELKAYQNYDVSCFYHKPFEARQLALMLLQEH
jgi:YesN/AraC family two-component response regulator